MTTITRNWLAFAAIGTGLIHLALVIGAPLPMGVVLAMFGLVEFGWGVVTFARDSVLAPRVALVVAMLPIGLWGMLLVIANVGEMPQVARPLGFAPLAIASVLELFVASALAIHLRQVGASARPATPVSRYIVGLLAGALVVAALTSVALAATPAGGGAGPLNVQLPGHGH